MKPSNHSSHINVMYNLQHIKSASIIYEASPGVRHLISCFAVLRQLKASSRTDGVRGKREN